MPCGKRSRYWALPSSLRLRPASVAGLIPWSITHWEFRPPFFDLAGDARGRDAVDRRRSARAYRLVCALCAAGARHAGADRTAAEPGGDRVSIATCAIPCTSPSSRSSWAKGSCSATGVFLIYGGFMWLAFHAFVLAYEEPVLAESFGAQYEDFRANVPRWIPRLTPWRAV